MFDPAKKSEVLDYFFSNPHLTASEVCGRFGYPSPRTLNLWSRSDPRWTQFNSGSLRGKVCYTDVQKNAIIEYCRKTPDFDIQEVVIKFGYPSDSGLRSWLVKAGVPIPPRRESPSYTSKQIEEVCRYAMEHPEMTRVEVCNLFGFPSSGGVLTDWCVQRYGERGKPQGMYPAEQKAYAVEECFANPEVPVKELMRRIGFPFHVAAPLIRKDPRWADDPRNPAVKSRIVGEVIECYFADVSKSFNDVAREFGGSYTSSGIAKLVRKDPRYGDAAFYGYTEEQKAAALSFLRDNPGTVTRHLPKGVGFAVEGRVVAEWRYLDPELRKRRKNTRRSRRKTFAQKHECVSLVVNDGLSRAEAARRCGLCRTTVTNWLREYRRKGLIALVTKSDLPPRRKREAGPFPDKKAADYTPEEVERLRQRNKELEFENDVLRAIFDTLKKEPGLSEESLTNKEKTLIINALRPKYKLRPLLERFGIAKSSYEYNRAALEKGDKDAWLKPIVADVYHESGHAYGYRRIWGQLRKPRDEGGYGIRVSEKVVRRITKELGLVTLPAMRLKRYNSYRGSVGRIAPNLLQRDFKAERPWEKLLTDITEFHLNGYKVYLSPLIDCYNGEVVSYTIATSPKLSLVMRMLSEAIRKAGPLAKPIVHSDQGSQYQSQAFSKALEEAGWQQSMSRKGCCSDNSACEGFFGRLKNEFFYNHDFRGCTPEQFMKRLGAWIEWYNNVRIKESLGFMSPVDYRTEESRRALLAA